MASKSIKDATKALQEHFSAVKVPTSLPIESRHMLQHFVDEYASGYVGEEESTKANTDLRTFWEKHVRDNTSKFGAFAGVLRELRPVIAHGGDMTDWWQIALKPVTTSIGCEKASLDDAQDFLVNSMIYDETEEQDEDVNRKTALQSKRLLDDLLNTYVSRTRIMSDDTGLNAPENTQVAQQIENVLIAFGRKQPKSLFHALDDLVRVAATRLQALTLLSCFLRHPTPHLYLVMNTPLVEHLLKCLMNDTSTAVLSTALTSLIMLFPHIPGSLGPHLPRLFLVYSRLLCWEKFSPLSTEAQRSLVTDDRVAADSDEERDGDVGIDLNWDKLAPKDDMVEASTPELMTLFTYLYGMYPLNFLSYIRKSRRYLKNLDFPGAQDFDLDQAVIRSRTDQFRQVHLIHPNFYNMTIEEELVDPKWPRTDPADVVAMCHGLCIYSGSSLAHHVSISNGRHSSLAGPASGRNSPIVHGTTIHSATNSWRDTTSHAGDDSPIIKPDMSHTDDDIHVEHLRHSHKPNSRAQSSIEDFAHRWSIVPPPAPVEEKAGLGEQTNAAFLQRENTLLRNELNFERWHKAQYSQHIGQLVRKNVKDATAEAETLNLINANRALKQQLEQVRNAREATIKDSALTRKQSNSLEVNLNERLVKMRKDQEKWVTELEELQRLRKEAKEFKDILVATEARELNKSHELTVMKREMEQMDKLRHQLQDAQKKLREYEYRDFEFDRTKREMDILQNETHTMQMRIRSYEVERERTQRIHTGRVAELEAQLESMDPFQRAARSPTQSPPEMNSLHHASDSEAKLVQLKKAHARLLEKFTDLELECQSVKSQLESIQQRSTNNNGRGFMRMNTDSELQESRKIPESTHYTASAADAAFMTSTSDPTNHRFQSVFDGAPVSPPANEAAVHDTAGLTWRPPPASNASSRDNYQAAASLPISTFGQSLPGKATSFNPSAPLSEEEMARSMLSSSSSADTSSSKKRDTIQPDSEVRVYGRGGAQNIKMKSKEKPKSDKPKSSPLKGLRGFI